MTDLNVLLLVVDSLRADAALNDDVATPTLDRLRTEGVTFTNCFSQGISTAPAMTTMLTGRLPLDYSGHWYLNNDQPTFAEAFRGNGYSTGAVHSNPYVSARRNFDRGFDSFHEDIVSFEPDGKLEELSDKLLRVVSRASRILSHTPYTTAEGTNEQIREFTTGASSPWFCWAQYMDVHGPYLGGDDFRYRNKFYAEWLWRKAAVRDPDSVSQSERDTLRRNYRREIEYLDDAIGSLLNDLKSDDDLSDTLVVVTADHGDEFHEHGQYGHGNLPYDELIRVPLIFRFPDDVDLPRGETVDSIVRCLDIVPTALDIVEADLSEQHRRRLAGESLLPLVRGENRDESPVVVTEKRVKGEDSYRIGFRTECWKYLYDGTTGERVLYDLEHDPGETTDVSTENLDECEQFERRLRDRLERIEETAKSISTAELEESVHVKERLKALGYRE